MALVRGRAGAAERVLKWGAERERVSIRMLGYPVSIAFSPVSLRGRGTARRVTPGGPGACSPGKFVTFESLYKWLEMH